VNHYLIFSNNLYRKKLCHIFQKMNAMS